MQLVHVCLQVEKHVHEYVALQLRELEHDEVVTRTVYPVIPPKVEYALTERGTKLQPIITQLKEWGKHIVKED
jgi:DNA-binding HxlR family transcriptional regulator